MHSRAYKILERRRQFERKCGVSKILPKVHKHFLSNTDNFTPIFASDFRSWRLNFRHYLLNVSIKDTTAHTLRDAILQAAIYTLPTLRSTTFSQAAWRDRITCQRIFCCTACHFHVADWFAQLSKFQSITACCWLPQFKAKIGTQKITGSPVPCAACKSGR